MEFKLSYSFPVIIVILAVISVLFLTEIEPFNYVISGIILIIAAVMGWRIYYDFTSSRETQKDFEPSDNVKELLSQPPKQSKMKLDDFLKSSPKSFSSKPENDFSFSDDFSGEKPKPKNTIPSDEPDPFSDDALRRMEYLSMKKKMLNELKDVIKPKKKGKEEDNKNA